MPTPSEIFERQSATAARLSALQREATRARELERLSAAQQQAHLATNHVSYYTNRTGYPDYATSSPITTTDSSPYTASGYSFSLNDLYNNGQTLSIDEHGYLRLESEGRDVLPQEVAIEEVVTEEVDPYLFTPGQRHINV